MWNFKDAIKRAAEEAGISQTRGRKFLKAFFNTIYEALNRGESVKIPRWFAMIPVLREKRRGINPRTKEAIFINDRYRIKFKPLKNIKAIQDRLTAHLDARKVAETYVSELFLYYADRIDHWVKTDELDEYMDKKLADAREAYARRVPQWVREETDYFEELLRKMINERKKRLGLI